jgi:hypothetical protein
VLFGKNAAKQSSTLLLVVSAEIAVVLYGLAVSDTKFSTVFAAPESVNFVLS